MAGDPVDWVKDRLFSADPERLVKKAEVDSGQRAGIPTEMAERMKALEQ